MTVILFDNFLVIPYVLSGYATLKKVFKKHIKKYTLQKKNFRLSGGVFF